MLWSCYIIGSTINNSVMGLLLLRLKIAAAMVNFVGCHSAFGRPPLSGKFNVMSLENQGKTRKFDNQYPVGTLSKLCV